MEQLGEYLNKHIPVMLHEAIESLNIKPDGIYIDGTFGCGGHSKFILNKLNFKGKLIVVDLDVDAIKLAFNLQQQDSRVLVVHGSFKDLKKICAEFNINAVDGVLLDLGVSSPQLDNPLKGFSFLKQGPLDLRMDQSKGISAKEWLAKVEFSELFYVLKNYGQEKFAKKIALEIIKLREKQPILTTLDLANLIQEIYPRIYLGKHPATKTFQAIRIFINQELITLQFALPEIITLLKTFGRLVVISFHSLEDSIVKEVILKHSQKINNRFLRKLPQECLTNNFKENIINLKNLGKIKPSLKEISLNKRSRSAIMRIAEKCA